MNWLLKLIFAALGELMTGVVKVLADFINNIFGFMYEINNSVGISDLETWSQNIAFALVTVIAMKKIFSIYILQNDGDPDQDPFEMLTRLAVAVAVIVCGKDLMQYGIKMAGVMADEAIAMLSVKKEMSAMLLDVLTIVCVGSEIEMFIYLIFLTITIASLIIFCLKAGRRAAELILFSIMLPLVACDLVTTQRERWNAFFTELMLCIFGYVLQVISFTIFGILFSKIGAALNIKYMIAALAWLTLVLSVPKWVEKFVHNSGVGNTAKGAIRTATFMLPYTFKRVTS